MTNVGLFIPNAPNVTVEETSNSSYSGMTVAQLREYAVNNGIDLGTAKTRADIITIITAVMG